MSSTLSPSLNLAGRPGGERPRKARAKPPRVDAKLFRVSDDQLIRVVLPWPPPLNNMYQTDFRTRRRFLSKRGTDFKKACECLLIGARPWTGPVTLQVNLFRPRKCGDIDGVLKPILDVLKNVAYLDDEQVCDLRVLRFEDKDHPRAVVWAEPSKGNPEREARNSWSSPPPALAKVEYLESVEESW